MVSITWPSKSSIAGLVVTGAVAVMLALVPACRFNVDWSSHASYRSAGKELQLAQIDPDEAVQGVISANLHYMTVALDTVFARNLPGLTGQVALGVEITGILPGGKAIQTVLDVKRGAGEHGFLGFDNVALIEPFLYTGQNLTITLHFRAVGPKETENLKGRLAAAEDLVKKINPAKYQALETGIDLFKSVISGTTRGQKTWKYQVTLHPADSVYRDKPEMLLTAARHILLFTPPPSAPSEASALRMDRIVPYLRLRGNRLIWRHNEQEYTATPYLILNITRYRRYPKEDTELRQVARKLDQAIEEENFERARSHLKDLGAAINADRIITTQEKNLEKARKELREAKINAAEARKRGQHQQEVRHLARQIRLLSHIRTQFTKILYPYETKEIDYRVSQLALRAELLGKDHGVPVESVQTLASAHRTAAAALAQARPQRRKRVVTTDLTKLPPPPVIPKWKHLYQKWWFWTLVSVGVVGAGAAAYALGSSAPTRTETFTPVDPSLPVPFPRGKVTP